MDMRDKLKALPQALVVNMKIQLSGHLPIFKVPIKSRFPYETRLIISFWQNIWRFVKGKRAECRGQSHVTLGQKCTFLRGEKAHMSIALSHKDVCCALSSFLCVTIAMHTLWDLERVSTDSNPLMEHHRHGFTFNSCVCLFLFCFFSSLDFRMWVDPLGWTQKTSIPSGRDYESDI